VTCGEGRADRRATRDTRRDRRPSLVTNEDDDEAEVVRVSNAFSTVPDVPNTDKYMLFYFTNLIKRS
jgi:hypothetical protein